MKLIPLTQGKFAMVDDEDYEELNQFKWCADRSKHTWYAKRWVPQSGPSSPGRHVRMHAAISGFPMTDHIDGDGLNNQRSNLRAVDYPQNSRNSRARVGGLSTYKGVSFHRRAGRWVAQIRSDRRTSQYIGLFDTEEEAALAYDKAARELHGPYAALNYPSPGERSALTGERVPRG